MRIQISLLFVILAVNDVISFTWPKIQFPLKLLQADVQAISQYYDKEVALQAFVHWPDSIVFSIQMIQHFQLNEFYLKINGTFRVTAMGIMTTSYDGIYYRDGDFYVRDGKTNAFKMILPEKKVTYIQPKIMINLPKTYLSIKYFSFKELKEVVEPFYFKNKEYVDSVLRNHPVTFLASVEAAIGHFIEYTFWGKDHSKTLTDGKLRVLFGRGRKGKILLTNDTEAYRLVFDQRNHIFNIPENFNMNSKPLEGVFGFRMATEGFLVKVHENDVQTFSKEDLTSNRPIQKQHSMFVQDLLEKVKTVEPRFVYSKLKPDSWLGTGPTQVKFQVHGQVLTKSVNFNKNGYIDHYCPFTIEYENKGRKFHFRERWVDKLYTDDYKLWADGEGRSPDHKEKVSLMY